MEGGTTTKRKLKRLKMPPLIFAILTVTFLSSVICSDIDVQNRKNNTYESAQKDSRGFFSPRMDYDQWRPVGRGDPLQNDPTYDYVPPVLERVHYWVEPPMKNEPLKHEGKKSEILILGVSSKKPSVNPSTENRRNSHEPFMKFIDGPKFYHQHPPNFMRNGNQGQRMPPHPFHYQFHKNKFDDPPQNQFKPDEQRMPYTVLVPPPMMPSYMEMPLFKNGPPTTTLRPVYKPTTTTTTPAPTTPSAPKTTVSIQESNLVYQSSSTLKNNRWQNSQNQINQAGSQYVTWRTPTEAPVVFRQEISTVRPSAATFTKSSSENIINFKGQESKVPESQIIFPTETSGRIVFEKPSSFKSPPPVSSSPFSSFSGSSSIVSPFATARPPLVLAPTPGPPIHMLHVTGSRPVTAHLSAGHPIHKGHVSDDTIGNTYVNIGKPNAHIHQEDTFVNNIRPLNQLNPSLNRIPQRPIINSGMPFRKPTTEDAIVETMQTMQPPPITTEKVPTKFTTKKPTPALYTLLQKEISTQSAFITSTVPPTTYSFLPTSPTTPTPTTTATASLTTDPLFKHYKQPKEPLKGPMYLIIQGHSKVKTYGPSPKEPIRGIPTAETNEIHDTDNKYPVKHLHNKKENVREEKQEYVRTRVKNGRNLKDFLPGDVSSSSDIQETELGARYKVADAKTEVTSETYHKGIVESEELERDNQGSNKVKSRNKRQLEEFLPVMEDTVENFVYDYLKKKSEGSGVGAMLASAITNDSSEDDDIYDDEDEEEGEDEDEK